MRVWVAIIEDRHTDVDARVFSREDDARGFAEGHAKQYALDPGEVYVEEYDEKFGVVWTYSYEGDSVRVAPKDIE